MLWKECGSSLPPADAWKLPRRPRRHEGDGQPFARDNEGGPVACAGPRELFWDRDVSQKTGQEPTLPAAARPAHAPARRHPGDVVRFGLGMAALAASALAARPHQPGSAETDVFRLVNHLPETLRVPLRLVMQAGSVAALPSAVVLALLAHRPRLARDVGVAGTAAWMTAKAVKLAVNRERPGVLFDAVTLRVVEAHDLGFPSSHAAIAAALAAAAGPYVGRRTRRVLWGAALTVAFARVYVGVHLPADVLGGLARGWVFGSGVHLAWGRPEDPGAVRVVREALGRHGIEVAEVVPLQADARRSSPFV